MSSLLPEQPLDSTVFLPEVDDPPDPEDALLALETALETFPGEDDLVVDEGPPPPLGRSWQFDFTKREFEAGPSRSPRPTRDTETLQGWIEKALRTARGAHPVSPDGYGMRSPAAEGMIGGPVGLIPPDLDERVREALTFHPRITDVRDFAYDHDPDGEWVRVWFTYELDGETELRSDTVEVVF